MINFAKGFGKVEKSSTHFTLFSGVTIIFDKISDIVSSKSDIVSTFFFGIQAAIIAIVILSYCHCHYQVIVILVKEGYETFKEKLLIYCTFNWKNPYQPIIKNFCL